MIAQYLTNAGMQVVGTYHSNIPNANYPTVQVDLSKGCDIDGKFDIVVHCAGALPYNTSDFRKYYEGNVCSMLNLLDYCDRESIPRMIYLSTIGIYGEFRKEEVDEDTESINPDDYGLTKHVAEQLLKNDENVAGLSLRMPGVIGKGARGVWFTNTVDSMKKGEDVTVYSPDFKTGNFVGVDDLAMFIGKLINTDAWKYSELVLASEKRQRIIDIVEAMKKKTASSSRIIEKEAARKPFALNPARAYEMGYESLSPIELVDKYAGDI